MTIQDGSANALPEPVRPALQPRDGWGIAAPSGALAKLICDTPNECAAIVGRMDRGLALLRDGFRIVPVRVVARDDEPDATANFLALIGEGGR